MKPEDEVYHLGDVMLEDNMMINAVLLFKNKLLKTYTLKPTTGYVLNGIYGANTVGATKKITKELINNLSATGSKNLPKSVT